MQVCSSTFYRRPIYLKASETAQATYTAICRRSFKNIAAAAAAVAAAGQLSLLFPLPPPTDETILFYRELRPITNRLSFIGVWFSTQQKRRPFVFISQKHIETANGKRPFHLYRVRVFWMRLAQSFQMTLSSHEDELGISLFLLGMHLTTRNAFIRWLDYVS